MPRRGSGSRKAPNVPEKGSRPATFDKDSIDWCRASFNASTMLANLAAALPPPGRNVQRDGVLTQAADVLSGVLLWIQGRREESYSRVVRLPAVVLAAGIASFPDAYGPRRRFQDAGGTATSSGPKIDPNLLSKKGPLEVIPILLDRSSAILLNTSSAATAKQAKREGWPGLADRLIEAVEREPAVSVRCRYNIACYKVGRQDFDGALAALELVLPVQPLLRAWSEHDPTLDLLRKKRPSQWTKLLGDGPTKKVEPDVVD